MQKSLFSSAFIERPSIWRPWMVAAMLALLAAPALMLMGSAWFGGTGTPGILATGDFAGSLTRGIAVVAGVATVSFGIGLGVGLLAGVYDFPLRLWGLAGLALPLVLPSFLIAIGLAGLAARLGLTLSGIGIGYFGTVLSGATLGIALVTFAVLAVTRGLSRGQLDAARVAGGERAVLLNVARRCVPAAGLGAGLAGVLALADPGPGQIFGFAGVASEILGSFSARYDFTLAARQCATAALVALAVMLPPVVWLAPRISAALLAREAGRAPLASHPDARIAGPFAMAVLILAVLVLPLAGLAWPLTHGPMWTRAAAEIARGLGATVRYGLMSAILAIFLGTTLALLAGRNPVGRALVLAGAVVALSMPSALPALAFVQLSGSAPAVFDWLLRSELTVALCLAMRLAPMVAVFAMCAFGASSPSWALAAAVQGVSPWRFARRVLVPWLARALVPAAVLAALVAIADVSTHLLLHPPGHSSLALGIFTIMANAPEALVASQCALYLALAALVLAVPLALFRFYSK